MTDDNRPLCIYHANCIDGFTAAWAVWKALGDEFEYYPGIYQQDPPNVSGRGVVMVDFTYPREVVEAMFDRGGAEYILILDHHLSAAKQWADVLESWDDSGETFGEYYKLEPDGRTLQVIFDMNESGASMAWRNYHGAGKMPLALCHVRDRDLWRHQLPNYPENLKVEVEALHMYLSSLDQTFENWDMAMTSANFDNVILAGTHILYYYQRNCTELLKAHRIGTFEGCENVPIINLPYIYASDVGHALCDMYEEAPFAVIYWDQGDQRTYSLRSHKDRGIDVGEFARQFGGGGHRNSAGFKRPLTTDL